MRISPRILFPSLVLLGFGAVAAVCEAFALYLPDFYAQLIKAQPELRPALEQIAAVDSLPALRIVLALGLLMALAAIVFSQLARPLALRAIQAGCIATYVLAFACCLILFNLTGNMHGQKISGGEIDGVTIFYWRWHLLKWPGLLVIAIGYLHILSLRGSIVAYFKTAGQPAADPAGPGRESAEAAAQPQLAGDRILENLRTHGRDPRFRKSFLSSALTHLAVLVIIPQLLQAFGCVENYLIPKGSGEDAVIAMIQVVKPPKKKVKKKLLVNPNSAILFNMPELDDSDIPEQVEEATQMTETADPNRVHNGKPGTGGPGKGGWPDGSDKALFRFVRLDYGSNFWDDGMDATHADVNFMQYFKKKTGFKVAEHSESIKAWQLKKFDKGYAPPFLYMTGGDKGTGSTPINMSQADRRALREYLLEGGMLVADCGSVQWGRNFESFIATIFPDQPYLTIADDDPLYQSPYGFPNGVPSLWHHAGYKARGIKIRSRWAVFFHPGDMNDAWKTGRSGLDASKAEHAYQMGVNIIYYSFTHYLQETKKYRK